MDCLDVIYKEFKGLEEIINFKFKGYLKKNCMSLVESCVCMLVWMNVIC